MTTTYSGSRLELTDDLPSSNDAAGFGALTFVAGACALQEVPAIMREWATVTENLVCQRMNIDKKGVINTLLCHSNSVANQVMQPSPFTSPLRQVMRLAHSS